MIRNLFKTALRNIVRYKGYSLINIFGLSIAMAFFIFIFMYVMREHSYDRFHENGDYIYHVCAASDSMVLNLGERLGPALAQQYPEIEAAIRYGYVEAEVKVGTEIFKESVYAADPTFFQTFSFPLQTQETPFPKDNQNVIVISPEIASKYFGSVSPLNKILTLNLGGELHDFVVSGVIRPIPMNSSIAFDLLIPTREPMFQEEQDNPPAWQRFEFATFIRLSPSAVIAELEMKTQDFLEKNMGEIFTKANLDVTEFKLLIQPFKDFHLQSHSTTGGLRPTGNPLHSLILTGLGLLVLLISSFNFINLTIARSSSRYKEIGVRKVLGASKLSMIKQFWIEALTVSLIALFLGIFLFEILRPLFSSISGRNLNSHIQFYSISTLLFLLGMTILIAILAGILPALSFSRIEAVKVFKGLQRIDGRNRFSKIVLILQFAISLFLIIESIVIFKQRSYLLTKDVGFRKENILAVSTKNRTGRINDGESLVSLFKRRFATNQDVLAVTGASSILDKEISAIVRYKDRAPVITVVNRIACDYFDTMEIELADGRYFQIENMSDLSDAVIVNEAFLKSFDIQDPIGKRLPDLKYGRLKNPVIIGVTKDFNYISLRDRIYPMIMHMDDKLDFNFIVLKIAPRRIAETLFMVREAWAEFRPDDSFEYFFLDEYSREYYQDEERWSRIVGFSAIFTILIASLGLFGLTGISIARRFKEIGIRRVLGASSLEIVKMINREFIALVVLANLIVWPIAYYVSSKWLESFSYRTTLTPAEFFLGGIIILGISIATISTQVFKASILNPAHILRRDE